MPYFTYILACRDGTYYTGYTTDLVKRMQIHNEGKGAKYTRGRLPVQLVYSEKYTTAPHALKREREIKQLKKVQKIALVNGSTTH